MSASFTTSRSSTSTGGSRSSLHLKLPGDLPLDAAHEIAEQVEAAIRVDVPEVRSVQTHLEPLRETAAGEEIDIDTAAIEALRKR